MLFRSHRSTQHSHNFTTFIMSKRNNNNNSNNSKKNTNKSNKNISKTKKNEKKNNGDQSYSKPVRQPFSSSVQTTSKNPRFSGSPMSPIIKHSELVGPISPIGDSQFHINQNLRLNPGSQNTFKWLSQIAGSWEFYRFRKLKFRYVTRSNIGYSGSILMAPDYDAADSAPVTEQEMSSFRDCKEDAVWKNFTCLLNEASLNALYKKRVNMDDVRFSTTTQDKKTIDAGRFYVAEDVASPQLAGKLWVDYEVEFMTPQPLTLAPQSLGGINVQKSSGLNISSGGPLFFSSATTAVRMDTPNVVDTSPIANSAAVPTNNLLLFNKDWSGLLNAIWQGSGITGTPTVNITGQGTATNIASTLGATAASRSTYINAKAGDILGFSGGLPASSISGLGLDFGSSTNILL